MQRHERALAICALALGSACTDSDGSGKPSRTTGAGTSLPPILSTASSPTDPGTGTPDTGGTAAPGPWEVRELWHWPGLPIPGMDPAQNVLAPPAVGQLTDDDGDGDVDADDVPDVVVSAFATGAITYALVALDGRDGSELWSVLDLTNQASAVAIADVAGDALPEVLTLAAGGDLVALTVDGQPVWRTTEGVGSEAYSSDPIVVADLEGDGAVEILVSGSIVAGETGSVVGSLDLGGGPRHHHRAVVADLDGDGAREVVADFRVFAADGAARFDAALPRNLVWAHQVSVVQADADPDGEVLFHGSDPADFFQAIGAVQDPDGTVVASYVVADSYAPGALCTGDLDGDGITEIVRPGRDDTWMATELDGSVSWTVQMPRSTGAPGCTLGDLDGDGALEVLLSGGGVGVVDGATGNFLMGPLIVGYGTQYGGGAWVDLDGDGSTELIVVGEDYAHDYSAHGVIVLSHVAGAWSAGAPSWPTSSPTRGAFDALGHPLPAPAWWLTGDPYPGP